MDINRLVLDNAALNMSAIIHKHNYGTINIDEPVAEGIYVYQSTSMKQTLNYSI